MSHEKTETTILLTRQDVCSLLTLDECISAVEAAFRRYGEGKVPAPGILGVPSRMGGFHIKAALFEHEELYFAVKINANFPQNKVRFHQPSIQGVILLCHGEHGSPLAVMDSMEITAQRTGAATAIAAKYLSREDSKTVTVCGCGNQGRIQLKSLLRVRDLKRAYLYDVDYTQAKTLASEFSGMLAAEPVDVPGLQVSLKKSDICVTCTPSARFYVNLEDISPGTFIAAIGADSENKQEIDPRLFGSSTIVVDMLEQCVRIGDLHHAIEEGLVAKTNVHAELGDIVAGRKPGRTSPDEITLFDSTGMALQDAAAAVVVYEKALASGSGSSFTFR